MQLHLTLAELRLLSDILEEKRFVLGLANSAGHGSGRNLERRLQELEEMLAKLNDKRLAFSSEEFVSISEILSETEREWYDQLPCNGDSGMVSQTRRNTVVLQSLKDKIVECCAMF